MTTNKHKNLRFAYIIMTIIMFCLTLTGCSSDKDVSIEVSDITKNSLVLDFENNTENKLRFGWVNSCEIIIETTEDTYYLEPDPFNLEIKRGNSQYTVDISDCDGEIYRVEITELIKLNDRGLPDTRIKDIVVYDADKNIESYSGSFSLLSGSKGFIIIAFSVIGALMLIIITIFVIIAVRTSKSNKKAVAQFTPFNHGQNANAYYHDQVIRENNRIQNDMNNMAHQQGVNMHNQAHQHAVDINNHNNGFTPPPSPPNF